MLGDHLTTDEAIGFILTNLSDTRLQLIRRHLRDCPDCCNAVLDVLRSEARNALYRGAPEEEEVAACL